MFGTDAFEARALEALGFAGRLGDPGFGFAVGGAFGIALVRAQLRGLDPSGDADRPDVEAFEPYGLDDQRGAQQDDDQTGQPDTRGEGGDALLQGLHA